MKSVPTENEWENYKEDLDTKYAHDLFIGKTNEQMLSEYKDRVLARSEDIYWMPIKPFQYYIFGFRDFVIQQDFGICEGSDAASSFLNLVIYKLEKKPEFILSVLPEIMKDIDFIANNQELFDADEDIYGSFKDKLQEIKRLYKNKA
jgi:hypothetical protein